MPQPFRVLFVCTGNICRSPMAQMMLTHRLRERLGDAADAIEVTSAGTGALVGYPMEQFALDALAGLGLTPGEFAAREVDPAMLADTDLVLAATRQHRSLVVSAQPSVVRRAFTLKEFARLAGSLADQAAPSLPALVERVAGQRGAIPAVTAADDDVDDPYGESADRFAATADELNIAVAAVADALSVTLRASA